MLRTIHSTLLVSLLCLSLSAQAWVIDRTFDVEKGGQLVVSTDIGSIDVETHDESRVLLEVSIDGFEPEDLEITFDHSGADLEVRAELPRYRWGHGYRHRQVEFVIKVPDEYNVDLSTQGGSISIEGLQGEIDVDTSGGSLRFRDIVGNIKGRTSGGSIDVVKADGRVRVYTSGGSIDVEQVTQSVDVETSGGTIHISEVGGDVDAQTSGGSIRIEDVAGGIDASTSGGSVRARLSEQPGGDVTLSTSGGGVTVQIADNVGMNLAARARKINSEFPVDGRTSAKKRLNGDINGGGPDLELRSSGGSISIRRI